MSIDLQRVKQDTIVIYTDKKCKPLSHFLTMRTLMFEISCRNVTKCILFAYSFVCHRSHLAIMEPISSSLKH